MAIDKRLTQAEIDVEENDDVEVVLPEDIDTSGFSEEETEDGGVVVDFDPEASNRENSEFEANLAEQMDNGELKAIASELVEAYKDDKLSRAPWEKAYIKGLSLLGTQIEERSQPWSGASGVFHPILTEAVTKFVADAMMETFPSGGPVLTKIGKGQAGQARSERHELPVYRSDAGIPRRTRTGAIPSRCWWVSVQEGLPR